MDWSAPYQHPIFGDVLHDLLFTGGASSFVARHLQDFQFRVDSDPEDVIRYAMPAPVIALVASAVSSYVLSHNCS